MQTGIINVRILLYCCAAILIVELLGGIVIVNSAVPVLPAIGLIRIIETFLIIAIVSRYGDSLASIGFNPENSSEKFLRGLLWSAGFGCVAGLFLFILHMTGMYPLTNFKAPLSQVSPHLVLFFLVGGVIAPIAEEFFFRGIIYNFLRRWGIILAIGGSTLIFSLTHYLTGNLQLTQIVGGLIFAVAYESEKSLIVPMVIHVLGNLAIFTLSLLV